MIKELDELCEREHLDPPQANIDLLNAWENNRARPRPNTIDLLARLYSANAIRLGLANDYSEDDQTSRVIVATLNDIDPRTPSNQVIRPDPGARAPDHLHMPDSPAASFTHQDAERRTLFHQVLSGTGPAVSGQILAEVERLRQQMDRTLAAGTVTEDQMDRLDETVLRCRREYTTTPPLAMLCQLMLEFIDVRHLAAQRQPGPIQRRLCHISAVLAVLSADALMKLGDVRQARAWYGTAKSAADDTGDPRLRALVRAQEAMLPYYYGDLAETVQLAREAQSLARSTPCSPTALAAAAEGRALARLGDYERATQALTRAQRLFSKIKGNATSTMAFDFSEQRLHLYLSGAHAHLPDAKQAQIVHERALALCAHGPSIDPALICLDHATTLARSQRDTEACELAEQTLLTLPPEHRTSIVFVRARDVRATISTKHKAGRALQRLDEALTLDTAAGNACRPIITGPRHG